MKDFNHFKQNQEVNIRQIHNGYLLSCKNAAQQNVEIFCFDLTKLVNMIADAFGNLAIGERITLASGRSSREDSAAALESQDKEDK